MIPISQVVPFPIFKEDCRHLSVMIADKDPENLFGIMRGGMVVACYLAHYLGMEAEKIFPIYKTGPNMVSPVMKPGRKDIVIDDIFDKGFTELDVKRTWPFLTFAALYSKNNNTPNIVIGRLIETTDYLLLPFEVDVDNVEQL